MSDEYLPTFADRMAEPGDVRFVDATPERERMRFHAACAAMQGMLAKHNAYWTKESFATDAVNFADALLSALYQESK